MGGVLVCWGGGVVVGFRGGGGGGCLFCFTLCVGGMFLCFFCFGFFLFFVCVGGGGVVCGVF